MHESSIIVIYFYFSIIVMFIYLSTKPIITLKISSLILLPIIGTRGRPQVRPPVCAENFTLGSGAPMPKGALNNNKTTKNCGTRPKKAQVVQVPLCIMYEFKVVLFICGTLVMQLCASLHRKDNGMRCLCCISHLVYFLVVMVVLLIYFMQKLFKHQREQYHRKYLYKTANEKTIGSDLLL